MTHKAPPFFVVGMPRSGTKVLREILNASPDVWIPDVETQFIPRYARKVGKYGDLSDWQRFHRLATDVSGSVAFNHWRQSGVEIDLRRWYERCGSPTWPGVVSALFELVHEQGGEDAGRDWRDIYWGDKTPQYVTEVPILAEVFPESMFVHIVRDARDVSMSISNTWGQHPLRAAQRWADAVRSCREAGARLGPSRYMEVRYEDLLQDPPGETVRVCNFLEVTLPKEPGKLAKPAEPGGSLEVVSDNAGKFERQMAPELQRKIEAITGRGLEAYGYPRHYPSIKTGALGPIESTVYALHDAWRTVQVRKESFGSWRRVLRSLVT